MIRKPRIVTFRLDEATWDRIRKVTHAASATGDRSRSDQSQHDQLDGLEVRSFVRLDLPSY